MIGDRLAELRKDKGLNQQDLADKLGLSLSTISSYERGINEPDDETKIALAKIFNISIDYLVGAIDEELPLIRENAVDLPKGFPKEAIPMVKQYINMVVAYYKQKTK